MFWDNQMDAVEYQDFVKNLDKNTLIINLCLMQDIKQIDKGVPSKPSGNLVVVPFIFICVLQGTEVSSS